MSDFEFWKDLGGIFDAILDYQRKNVEFNNRFINPWIRLGNIFDRDDQHKQAVQAYQRAIEIDPDNAQNWVDLGDALFKMGAHDEAIAVYQKAVELDPKSGWPLSNLGLTLVTQGKCEQAIPLFLTSIDLLTENKDKAISWNRLGNAYRKLNDYENAFLAFQKADELDGENTGFNDQLDETTETDTMVAPEEVLVQMDMDQAGNDKPEASLVTEVSVAVVVETNESESNTVSSEAKEEIFESEDEPLPAWLREEIHGEGHEAEEEPAKTFPVEEPVTQIIEEIVALNEEKVPETTPKEAPVVKVEVVHSEVAFNASSTSMDMMETTYTEFVSTPIIDPSTLEDTQPIKTYRKTPVEPVNETAAQPEVGKEANENEVEQERPAAEAAIPAVESVESRKSPRPVTSEAAYEEYLKDMVEPAGMLSDHVDDVHAGVPVTKVSQSGDVRIPMDTQNAHVWNELGNVYLNSGSCDDAIAAYGKAIELDRQFAWPYSNLALAYMQKSRFAEAILLYQRSIELFATDKDKAVTWNRLGNVYRRLNDYANAIAAYQTADDLDPDNATLSLRSHYGLLGNLYMEQQKSNYVS